MDVTEPFNFGTEATHECVDGFDLLGDGIRTCIGDGTGTINGTWNNTQPSCNRKFSMGQ